MLVGWFTHVRGTVFVDDNGNGRRDPGEEPVPGFTLTVRERDNSLMDQYTNLTTTDDNGVYDIKEGYPLSKWLVLEAFNTRYRTTGVTYQADNEDAETTILGGLVDINFLPVIGLSGRIDWGVEPYATNENGGIAATVSYDVTRNELDPADAVSEDYQPGIPDVNVHVFESVRLHGHDRRGQGELLPPGQGHRPAVGPQPRLRPAPTPTCRRRSRTPTRSAARW